MHRDSARDEPPDHNDPDEPGDSGHGDDAHLNGDAHPEKITHWRGRNGRFVLPPPDVVSLFG